MHAREGARWDGSLSEDGEMVFRAPDGRYMIVTSDAMEGGEGKYRVGFSETREYDGEHIKVAGRSVTLADIKQGLAGLADGSLVIGENRLEPAQTRENAPASGEGVVNGQVMARSANEAQREANGGVSANEGSVRRDLPQEGVRVDPTSVTEEDVRTLLERAKQKVYKDGSYIPVRANTPQVLIDSVNEYNTVFDMLGTTGGIPKVTDHPMAMPVYKARQAQANESNWDGKPQDKPHNLHVDEIIEIIKAMDDPEYIVFEEQKSGKKRYVEVVRYGLKKKAFVVIESSLNINALQTSGYAGGEYNCTITIYPVTTQKVAEFLKADNHKTIYDKKRRVESQRRSSIQSAFSIKRSPFANSISQNQQKSTDSGKKVAENVAEVDGSNRSALPRTRARGDKTKTQAKAEKKAAERIAEEMRGENGRGAEDVAPYEGNAERAMPSRGYTDAEANEARGLVKDFDLMPPSVRRSIVELIRSGEKSGASKNFLRHSANLIAYWRRGLWIIADDKTRDDGFYTTFTDGSRLIVVKPNREAKAVSDTLMHELAHDVWARADAATRKVLYELATKGVKQEEIDAIRERYREELTNRGELVKKDENGNEIEMTEAEVEALLDEEVATNLIGEIIGKEEFLKRFDGTETSTFKRILRTLSNMKKRFTGKDKYLYRKADDLFKAFTKVMALEEVGRGIDDSPLKTTSYVRHSIRPIVGDSGKQYGIGVYLDSTLLTNLTSDERVKMVKEYIKELGGSVFTAYDGSGNAVEVHLVEANRRFKNKNGRRSRVYDHMLGFLESEVKQEAIVLVDELIGTSVYEGNEPSTHSHGWVDNDGKNDWDVWKTYLQDKEKTVWEATLKIANSENGEKILYEVFPIKMVEQSGKPNTSTTNNSITEKSDLSTDSSKKVVANSGSNRSALPKRVQPLSGDEMITSAMERGMGVKSQTSGKVEADAAKKAGTAKPKKTAAQVARENAERKAAAEMAQVEEKAARTVRRAQKSAENAVKNAETLAAQKIARTEEQAARRVRNAEKSTENAIKNAEKKLAAENARRERESSETIKRSSREIARIDKNLDYLKNAVLHRSGTDGGTASAIIFEDPALRAVVKRLASRGTAYGLLHKSTREGMQDLLAWYTPENEILKGNAVDELLAASPQSVSNVFGAYNADIREKIERIANGEGDITAAELADLDIVVNAVARLYLTYGKVKWQGKRVGVEGLAFDDYREQMETRRALIGGKEADGKPTVILKKIWNVIREGYLYSVVTPEVVLRDCYMLKGCSCQ